MSLLDLVPKMPALLISVYTLKPDTTAAIPTTNASFSLLVNLTAGRFGGRGSGCSLEENMLLVTDCKDTRLLVDFRLFICFF